MPLIKLLIKLMMTPIASVLFVASLLGCGARLESSTSGSLEDQQAIQAADEEILQAEREARR